MYSFKGQIVALTITTPHLLFVSSQHAFYCQPPMSGCSYKCSNKDVFQQFHIAECEVCNVNVKTCICINTKRVVWVCVPVNTHEPCPYAHAVRRYAPGLRQLLPVLCLFYHKKVTAWFMHLFSELDGNCLCFGAPDPIKTGNAKM